MTIDRIRRGLSALRDALPAAAGPYCACPPIMIERVKNLDGTVTEPEIPEVCPDCGRRFDPEGVSFIEINIEVIEAREGTNCA